MAQSPARIEALFAAALQLSSAGRLAEAEPLYRQVLALDPLHADSLHNLGVAAGQTGRNDLAVELIGRAVAIDGARPGFHSNLGLALKASGQLTDAAEACRRAIVLDPRHAGAYNNLGAVLMDQGDLDGAAVALARALALRPAFAAARNNLGTVRVRQGRLDEAEAAYREALAQGPDYPQLLSNLGGLMARQGRPDEAAQLCRRAAGLDPRSAQAFHNLGNALLDQGDAEKAGVAYARALALKPDLAEAESSRLLALNYEPGVSMETLLTEHRRWDPRHGRVAAATSCPNPREPERRLRIGYVSGDFRIHPVGWFLGRALAAHDPAAMEAICYSNSPIEDDRTAALKTAAHAWRDISSLSDPEAASLIAADGIDILVDLSGHTAENRLPLFARRPAPVQASFLGYPGTTGLAAIDYLLTDAAAVPPGAERWCSEAVVRLEGGRFAYDPPSYAPEVAGRMAANPVVFASFNNLAKLGPDVVRLWAAALAAVPESRLLLKWKSLGEPATRDRIARAFADAGLAPGRLELRPASPHAEMLAEYGEVDIALDPFPFCGGLTSCEALWMGVPVVTLPGERPASRQTLGFLTALNLGELAAASEADYVRIAATLAADGARLAALRATLRPRMAASALCDGPRLARSLEAAYRGMWRRYCSGEPPAGFDASP